MTLIHRYPKSTNEGVVTWSVQSLELAFKNLTWKWTFGKWWLFCDSCFFLAPFIVDRAHCKWTGISAVQVNYENERFTVVCSRCRQNLKIRNFTLSFGRWRQWIVLKCVAHVQHVFWCWRSPPYDKVKFSCLRFWLQRDPTASVNLWLFPFACDSWWKPFVPSKRKCSSPLLYNVINVE